MPQGTYEKQQEKENMAPQKADFGAARKEAEKSGALQSGDRFKIGEGANRVRILSEFLPHTSYYQGNRRFQWLGYIIDRKDGQVKTWFMPNSIHKFLEAIQQDPDWAFDEVPMEFDVTVNAKGAGTKEVEYGVTPSPKRVALTTAEEAAFLAKKPIAEVQQAIYEKQNETQPEQKQYEDGEVPA